MAGGGVAVYEEERLFFGFGGNIVVSVGVAIGGCEAFVEVVVHGRVNMESQPG